MDNLSRREFGGFVGGTSLGALAGCLDSGSGTSSDNGGNPPEEDFDDDVGTDTESSDSEEDEELDWLEENKVLDAEKALNSHYKKLSSEDQLSLKVAAGENTREGHYIFGNTTLNSETEVGEANLEYYGEGTLNGESDPDLEISAALREDGEVVYRIDGFGKIQYFDSRNEIRERLEEVPQVDESFLNSEMIDDLFSRSSIEDLLYDTDWAPPVKGLEDVIESSNLVVWDENHENRITGIQVYEIKNNNTDTIDMPELYGREVTEVEGGITPEGKIDHMNILTGGTDDQNAYIANGYREKPEMDTAPGWSKTVG